MRPLPLLLLLATLVLGTASGVSAQTLRGRLLDAATGAPVSGGFVILFDSAGGRVTAVLGDAAGAFLVRVPRAGRYAVQVERLGYATHRSESFELQQDVTEREFRLPQEAIVLPPLDVKAERRCQVASGLAATAATIWQEVRKTLALADWTANSGTVRYEVLVFERWLERNLKLIRDSSYVDVQNSERSPFHSSASDMPLTNGFIQPGMGGSFTFHGPDAALLLSDEFLDSYCFRAVANTRDGTLVGLAFAPIAARAETDITGTLWIDRVTYDLRFVEFQYTKLPWRVSTANSGGSVFFERLPDGGVIVSHWWLRVALVTPRRVRNGVAEGHYLYGFRESGRRVRAAHRADGTPIPLRGR